MRVNTTLLIVFVTLLTKASAAEDLYLEGEDEANEFLEVDQDTGIGGHLRRLKRDWSWNRPPPVSLEDEDTATEDDKLIDDDNLDSDLNGGSGAVELELEPEKEKTLRVTFVVMEPYHKKYSDRDSPQFQNFSKSLAEAVNSVFRDLPGTHRTSLVRIQSRPADEFSCKVTLDIIVTGDDTDRISETLRDYIRNRRMLSNVAVNDEDYSATVIDSGYVDNEAISQSEDQYNVPERGDGIPETTELPDLLEPDGDNIFGERPIGVEESETTEEIIPDEGGNDYEGPTEDTPLFGPDVGRDDYGRTTEGRPDYERTTEGRPDDGRYVTEGRLNEGGPNEGRNDYGRPNEQRPDGGNVYGGPTERRPDDGRNDYGRPNEQRPDGGNVYGGPTERRPDDGRNYYGRPDYSRPTEGRPDYGRSTEGRPDYGGPTEGRPDYSRPTEGRPDNREQGGYEPYTETPGGWRNNTYGRPNEQRPDGGNVYGGPTERRPDDGRKYYGRPDYGRPTEGRPDYGRSTEGRPDYGRPTEGRPDYGRSTEGRLDYGRPTEGRPDYGRPTEGIPDYGRPTDGRPDYSRPTEGRPDNREQRGYEPYTETPGGWRNNTYGRPNEQRPDGGNVYGGPTERRPDDGRNYYGRPDYGRPTEERPYYGRSTEGRPDYGRPTEGRPDYGRSTEGRPDYGRPTEGRPDYGRPTEGRPDYGRPTEGIPDYDRPTEGRPHYSRPTEGRPDNREQGGYEPYTETPGGWRNKRYVDNEAISQSEDQYNVPERGDGIPETTELPDLLEPDGDNIFGERPIGVEESETTEEIIPDEGGNDYEGPTEDTPLFGPDVGRDDYGRTTEGRPDYGRKTEGRPDDGRYVTEGRLNEGGPNEGRNDYGRPNEQRPDGGNVYGGPTERRPDDGRNDYGRPNEQRPDGGNVYGGPTERRPDDGRNYGRPDYGRPTDGRPDYGRSTEGRPDYGRPTEGRPDYSRPTEGRPDNREQGGYEPYTETPGGLRNSTCPDYFMSCDETRCVSLSQRCDDRRDCDDGADEMGCPDKSCDATDFRCNNGKCIENTRRCNRQVDCPSGEDEMNCDCRSDEFRCEDDGSCIENRKRCNGNNECRDGSDELNCACTSDQWQCDYGYCIKRTKRCNGRVDCPTDRSDERNCVAIGYFKCRTGKLIPENKRCDRHYDCDPGDYSDEQNCPCGDGDFKCDNGYCIPANKKCDRTHDCQDGSDERDCTYGSVCMAYQYKCSSGQCVSAESRCNETEECLDGSDETNCPCKRGQFYCHDGTCINFSKRCNGQIDCQLFGEDEMNCGSTACGPDSFTCDAGSSVPCATKCDGNPECDNGEDEDGCFDECNHKCDGRCLQDVQICDGNFDCADGSDELQCDDCDGPNDFRCNSGGCINAAQHCNGEPECDDGSDEINCNITMISEPYGCLDNQFQCRDGACVNNQFFCDGHTDCNDNSDEENCPCNEGEWQCVSGQCIPVNGYCDGTVDCTDASDERDCPTTYRPFTTAYPAYPYPPTTTQRPIFTTTSNPNEGGCGKNEWRCENGPCIDVSRRCDGNIDCSRDGSDELDCPAGSSGPHALNLKTYPAEQTVRYGGDVVFSCRDEGPIRAPVRWIREGGRPLKPGSTDRKGRLEISGVTPADSGVYICQAPRYLGHPKSQIQVVLTVERSPATSRPFIACPPNQATCANGQCISRTAICDGNQDCADGSDEESCYHNGMCEPNEYQCANRKCVLKTWLCDAEDDCGDDSDEQNCGQAIPGQQCLPVEYACATNNQCIPKTFHCDGQSDCFDKSDEIGCAPVYVTRPPSPSNLKLYPGDPLTLRCEAVGVPTPLISWRLNWGNVPEKCTSTSSNGTGVLTCPNMQSQDSGAYSCEAINNKGTIFAAPDAIVYVNRTADVCPSGYFNSEARSESECIRCFCFGKSTQCQSADLFIFNMPTPLGEGGTRLVGVSIGYDGAINKDEDINNQYYYQPLRNGATVTKLDQFGSPWTRNSQAHPYLTLPESYNGNQLTSYGGSIKYRLSPHTFQPYAERESVPDIIILGKYQDLVHFSRAERTRELYIDAHLTPEYWQKPSSNGIIPASREDIMMTLDAIEMILLRADLNNAGANITEFTMVSAQLLNVGLGAASLVEECECPKGYKGRSCEKCADGYELRNSGPWNGVCVPKAPTCPPMTYGDPNNGGDCRACPCPLTNRGNQFASGCSIGPRGNVVCNCLPGYEGPDCSYCAPNYLGNPLVPGDSCKPKPQDNCNPIGTAQVRIPDECVCKGNVQGRYCDQCKNGSFFLSNDFKTGCALCFCSGIPPQNCVSSTLRRRTTTVRFNVPTVVDQLKVYNTAPIGSTGADRYITPVDTGLRPALVRGEVNINSVTRSEPSIFYWGLQDSFAGNKVTSYGGYLTYQLRNVQPNPSYRNIAADIQLVSDNSLTFLYFGKAMPTGDGYLNASVQFIESSGWQRSDGNEVTREHFLLALADVKTILIKATYSSDTDIASIDSASIETADEYGDGPMAQHVEQCICPPGYIGTSCEDCAPGYTRSLSGLYLRHCVPCDCNGHSNKCHRETGECFECKDNTQGPSCEYCRAGYEQDQANNCVPSSPTPRPRICNCDSRGLEMPCDESGYCICKQNVEGEACDRCRPGTFGLDVGNPQGCTACYCSGVTTDCREATHYARITIPASIIGENYGGYTLMDINAERVINDQFVPVVNESELMYVFSDQPIGELYWSLPVFPGNRILSYNGTLSLTQKFEVDPNLSGYPQPDGYPDESVSGTDVVLVGESQSIFWSNPTPIRNGEALSYQVPLRENEWFNLNTFDPTSRETFMSVLKNLKRILVRATLVQHNIMTTSIADVSMDSAIVSYDLSSRAAKGIEECMCPEGYTGTSCESCRFGYYKDRSGYCRQCNCNGHDCQLGIYDEIVCNCKPPYTGSDCSTVGLIMELHPHIHEEQSNSSVIGVSFTCKYRAPEPLTIKFYVAGREMLPAKPYTESKLYKDGWRGEHTWRTLWNTEQQNEVYECRTITKSGFLLGILSTTLPEKGTVTEVNESTTRGPTAESSVVVRIRQPKIQIQEVGGTVNFTCQARSRMVRAPLQINWYKADGYLPQGRSQVDSTTGLLLITNLQVSDSGIYICQTTDGVSIQQDIATLKVPGNDMTAPTVSVSPSMKEYPEGSRIEITCTATGNPAPRITWQRASNRALPRNSEVYESLLIIENAGVEDSGDYRCIATNPAGSIDRTAVITVRPRGPAQRGNLTVSSQSPTLNEGQSTRVVCTGTTDVPAGTLDWVRQDGTQFSPNVRADNGVLYIDVARIENEGVYICQTAAPGVKPVLVVLNVIPQDKIAPTISLSANSIKIPTGGKGEVECILNGDPTPLAKWTKHLGTFGPGTSQRDNTLIITNAQESDLGYYLCEGKVDGKTVVRHYVFVDIEKREKAQVAIYPRAENYALLGSEFQLNCYVTGGHPTPVITWYRSNGRPLSPGVKLLPNNVLKFHNVDVNDAGEYTCTASNSAGSVSASAVIEVRSPPSLTIIPDTYVKAYRGESIKVDCRADGYPEPEVSIKTSSNLRVLVPPTPRIASLSIPSLSDSDDGIYLCTASSPAGTMEEQFAIRVERGDASEENDLGNTPTVLKAIEHKETRIGCNASNEFHVLWGRADRKILQPNAKQIGNELVIYNTSKRDSGKYECTLINLRTEEVQQSAYTSLQVIAPPKITLIPPTQTVRPGQSPTVECLVEGDEITQILWRPYNYTSPSSRAEYRGSTLIFRQIEVEDAGQYECIALNSVANASGIAEVIVSEDTDRATSESYDNEQIAHLGAAVHLSCNVSQPNVRIRWTKDGMPVPRTINQKNDGSLFIRLAQKSDSGRYVCHIRDVYGRQTTNYINLHIEGIECLDTQFHCYDDSGCIDEDLLCDGFNDCLDSSDENNCIQRKKRLSKTLLDPNRIPTGPRDVAETVVAIDQPRRAYRVGDMVDVLCRGKSRDVSVKWERYGTNQFVDTRTYGDGSLLHIPEVQLDDVGLYRCTGENRYGLTSYDDFNLEVVPGQMYPTSERDTIFTAHLGDIIDLPCNHNLDAPVSYAWKREYSQLPSDFRDKDRNLHFNGVTEADAGTYICRVTNNRARVETRATLRVIGLVPKFNGDGWVSLPTLRDAYLHFDIEISFKPSDQNGVILYNAENNNGTGDFLILQLVEGAPELTLKFDIETLLTVTGDRPLQLNVWHTIRLNRSGSKITMDVDNTGPFVVELSSPYAVLDLNAPLYIGGAPDQRPPEFAQATGFVGCVSMLILSKEEKLIMDSRNLVHNVFDCDSCNPNQCLNDGVCQEARNERGYTCLCGPGFAGLNCDRKGEACRPGLCGPGKCTYTMEGYKCACPVPFTGKNCDVKQNIDYPAFTGSAYLAIKPPSTSRFLRMSMKIKAKAPVTNGIIMYCAQSPRGYGGFTSLAVRDSRLEFRYDVGDGNAPVILTSNEILQPNEWTDVRIARVGHVVSLRIDMIHDYEKTMASAKDLNLETPMFVGGVDDSIILNNNTGVTGGFSGCIKDVTLHGDQLDLIHDSIQSANVQECDNILRGDIPEMESFCSECRNGGYCENADSMACTCQPGFIGVYCEIRAPINRPQGDPCAAQPCQNGGTCRADRSSSLRYSCDCPLGYSSFNCVQPLQLLQSVAFEGNGYLALSANYLQYDQISMEPVLIALAFNTRDDGVLLYQNEEKLTYGGDYILLRVNNSVVVVDWDLGGGKNSLSIPVLVTDEERHQVIVMLYENGLLELTVDQDTRSAASSGISNVMNADSRIYIGGIPDHLNTEHKHPGLRGCIEMVEFSGGRSINLQDAAVEGKNTMRCKKTQWGY